MAIPFKIEVVEEMPSNARRNNQYMEIYEVVSNLEPDGKPIKIGPMDLKTANSVQTCVTQNAKGNPDWKVYTTIRNGKGEKVDKTSEEERWLFVQKVSRRYSDQNEDPEIVQEKSE